VTRKHGLEAGQRSLGGGGGDGSRANMGTFEGVLPRS
jgi:hypothetical protein